MPLNMETIKDTTGQISQIYTKRLVLNEPFIDTAARFSDMPGTVVLLSGGNLDCARYHIIGAKPWLTFYGRNQQMEITSNGQCFRFKADPFDTLDDILTTFYYNAVDLPAPISAGLFGYLSYDLKDTLETLPRTSIDDLRLPHISLFAASWIIIYDKFDDITWICIPERMISGQSTLKNDLAELKKFLAEKLPERKPFGGGSDGFQSNFTRSAYMEAIKQIKEYIASGHVYQVNMSQRFEMDFSGDAFALFRTLFEMNPAPFFAYIHAGNHRIVSTSPERFILQRQERVETRPIKGTRPRGKTIEEDIRFRCELQESKKDDAELSMIVDLLRNDLGKVCQAGTVRVAEHKRLEAYQNVYHLVSIVEGILDRNLNSVDLIRAVFPGGSITGCPKIRAMEIIDELEPNRRHIYTGSIGYISFHDTMDLSIAIRTAAIYNGKIIFSVGGGIVFDSDPSDEYDETLHKGQTLMKVFKTNAKHSENKRYAWINGSIKPIDDALIPVDSYGFQYGYGFFETIRVVNGKAEYLNEHIARFYRAWNYLFHEQEPDLSWDEIIYQVICKNGLLEKTAAVKIIAAKGNREIPPSNHTLAVLARPYTHRLEGKQESGLHAAICPYPRHTPLADYKTLNYLYYHLAGQWAKENGFDESLILNPDGTVSETNSANILLIKDKSVITPISPHVLPGIMKEVICDFLLKTGYEIKEKRVLPDELFSMDAVIMTNSLIGALPVISLDRRRLQTSELWKEIRIVSLDEPDARPYENRSNG